ncbi:MAG: ECF transporter S component [Bifidobacteriales bacterium]|nr:ECF transporter S component [Bifidobacteriales bacterium]
MNSQNQTPFQGEDDRSRGDGEVTHIRHSNRWRVVDIAVASVIGVASAFIYWVVAIVTSVPWSLLDGVIPGLGGILNGLYLFAAPLAILIVRRPGAAIYAEVVAAVLESLLGSQWVPVETFLIGLLQGAMTELVFALCRYRRWNLPTVTLSGMAAGLGCWIYTFCTHLQAISLTGPYGLIYLVATLVSGALLAGVLVWYLYLAIARTGALDRFESGRLPRNGSRKGTKA